MTDSVVSSGSSVVTGSSVSKKVFRVESGPSFVQEQCYFVKCVSLSELILFKLVKKLDY